MDLLLRSLEDEMSPEHQQLEAKFRVYRRIGLEDVITFRAQDSCPGPHTDDEIQKEFTELFHMAGKLLEAQDFERKLDAIIEDAVPKRRGPRFPFRALFVEPNGVLYGQRMWPKLPVMGIKDSLHHSWRYDPTCVNLVRSIIDATDCQLVLSTRGKWPNEKGRISCYIGMLRDHGIPEHVVTIREESDYVISGRGKAIRNWLREHPEVTNYCVLDPDQWVIVGNNSIQTDWWEGLRPAEAVRAIELLETYAKPLPEGEEIEK